jgi:hypothetical protein
MVVVGSSYFRPIGAGEVTGPRGVTGATGLTGPAGISLTGTAGTRGAGISGMFISYAYEGATGKLHTIWDIDLAGLTQEWDAGTTGGVTASNIMGATGNTWTTIDISGCTAIGASGGVTIHRDRIDQTHIRLKSIAVTGDSISISNTDTNTITVHFDMGNFGYVNVTGSDGKGATSSATGGVSAGNLVVNDGSGGNTFFGISGASGGVRGAFKTYSSSGLNIPINNYTEKSKYLLGSGGPVGGTFDFYNQNALIDDVPPSYKVKYNAGTSILNPNGISFFELDMTNQNGLSGDASEWNVTNGGTGPIAPIVFEDATFGYTGNNIGTVNNIGKAFTLIVRGATYGNQNNFQFSNAIWPFDRQPCFSGGEDIFNFFWLPCETRGDICPNGAAWHGNIVQWKSPDTVVVAGTSTDPFFCNDNNEEPPAGFRDFGGGQGVGRGTGKGDGAIRTYPAGQVDFYGTENLYFGQTGSTGACCRGNGECIHTIADLCTGFFHGAGTTCGITSGNTGSICFDTNGACCVYNEKTGKTECYEDFSSNECVSIGQVTNVYTTFGGATSACDDIDCNNASKDLGACCDGRGLCFQETETDCKSVGNFFLGVGTVCMKKDGTRVCSGGTGSCCRSNGTCEDGVTGESCISAGDIYAGDSSSCLDITCRDNEINGCDPNVGGLDLYPGAEYAGGVVVGLYRPLGSNLYGTPSFGKDKTATWDELMIGATGSLLNNRGITCDIYRSKYDYHGYGFTSAKGCSEYNSLNQVKQDFTRPDAYYIVVSMSPIAITGDREVIDATDYPGATQEFYWGNRGSSWGPLHNRTTNQYEDLSDKYKDTVFKLSEGYWYNGNIGDASLNILANNTFTSCRKARRLGAGHIQKLITKPIQTAHGMWHRNWGLYNNARIISADNALSQGYGDVGGGYTASDFGPGLTSDYISAFRATRLLDDNLSSATGAVGTNIPEVSPWYIPSQDEMSFIAAHCIKDSPYDINLNSELLTSGGAPIQGWHWTSTGAFDESKGRTGTGEGVIVSGGETADPGSLAWAMKFDIDGVQRNFRVGKKNRTRNTYKVRPIRMIRCDGQYATGGQLNEKLWKLPKVLRDEDRGINQQ